MKNAASRAASPRTSVEEELPEGLTRRPWDWTRTGERDSDSPGTLVAANIRAVAAPSGAFVACAVPAKCRKNGSPGQQGKRCSGSLAERCLICFLVGARAKTEGRLRRRDRINQPRPITRRGRQHAPASRPSSLTRTLRSRRARRRATHTVADENHGEVVQGHREYDHGAACLLGVAAPLRRL